MPNLWLTLDQEDGQQATLQLVRVGESDQPGMVVLCGWRYDGVSPGPVWARIPVRREVLPAGHERR